MSCFRWHIRVFNFLLIHDKSVTNFFFIVIHIWCQSVNYTPVYIITASRCFTIFIWVTVSRWKGRRKHTIRCFDHLLLIRVMSSVRHSELTKVPLQTEPRIHIFCITSPAAPSSFFNCNAFNWNLALSPRGFQKLSIVNILGRVQRGWH